MHIHQKKKKKRNMRIFNAKVFFFWGKSALLNKNEIAMSHDKQRNTCIFNVKGMFGYRLLMKTKNTVVK